MGNGFYNPGPDNIVDPVYARFSFAVNRFRYAFRRQMVMVESNQEKNLGIFKKV